MKTQHTPGPWNIRRISRFHDGTPQDFDFLAVDSECGTRMSLQQGATGNFVANARLIASAPDLLSALERLANEYAALMNSQGAAIDIGQPGSEFTAGQWVGSRLQSPMQEAWKAIAKAKGEA